MADPIINKVAGSGLLTIDPMNFLPKGETAVFDLKDHLFMGLILKEKDFREALKKTDWEQFRNKDVAITCSADAIIPIWAYMLVATYLHPVAREIVKGDLDEMKRQLTLKNLARINADDYLDKRIVIKGCGDEPIGEFVYTELTRILLPVAKSIMYGEPCSTVPVFKRAIHKD